jgi:hypothetical protein
MALVNKYKLVLMISLLWISSLDAQNQAGYFGLKNFIGIENNIFIPGFLSSSVNRQLAVINAIKYERRLNSLYTGGISLRYNRYKIKDQFTNDGVQRNYFVNYNGADKLVNNGSGVYTIICTDLIFQLKRFAKYRGFSPYGKFKAIKIGYSNQIVRLNKGYEFTYAEYYGTKRQQYVISGNEYLHFGKFIAGVEIGRTVRFFSDRWLLSYSLNVMTSFKKKFDKEKSLNERFMFEAERFVMNTKWLSLNFDLSYAF